MSKAERQYRRWGRRALRYIKQRNRLQAKYDQAVRKVRFAKRMQVYFGEPTLDEEMKI